MTRFDDKAVSALQERARRDVDSGLLPAAQFALAFEGEIVVSEALGDCTPDARFHMYSAVKPSVALTVLELAAEGRFDLDGPVSDVLESFGANGKGAVTVSQVLLHAGGFPPTRPWAAPRQPTALLVSPPTRAGASTGSREPASSITRSPRTGCWPTSSPR